jgi:hypothetical protein
MSMLLASAFDKKVEFAPRKLNVVIGWMSESINKASMLSIAAVCLLVSGWVWCINFPLG